MTDLWVSLLELANVQLLFMPFLVVVFSGDRVELAKVLIEHVLVLQTCVAEDVGGRWVIRG